MCSDFGLVQFEGGTFHCTKRINIKASSTGGHIVKWKSVWYGAKLVCTGSQELCQSLYLSLKLNLPRVEIQDFQDKNSKKWNKWANMELTENSGKEHESSDKNLSSPDTNGNHMSYDRSSNTSLEYPNLGHLENNQYEMNCNQSIGQFIENIEEFDNSDADPNYEIESNISSSSDSEEDQFKTRNKNVTLSVTSKTLMRNLKKPDSSNQKLLPTETSRSLSNHVSLEERFKLKEIHLNKNTTPPVIKNGLDSPIQKELSNSFLMGDSDSFSPVVIDTVTPSGKGKSKRYFCLFCKTLVTKFGRHLVLHHENESAVKKIAILPKGSRERYELISVLRKRGTFLFNTRKQYNDGHLIVSRRPPNVLEKKGNDYKVCPSCKDFYSKNGIRRHYKKCFSMAERGKKNLMPLSRALGGQIHKKANAVLRGQIFPRMREDCYTDIVRYDELAIVYGNYLCNKYRKPHLQPMIRSKLRLIGRLLIVIKNINKAITDFSSIFQPKFYDNIIDAVNQVALLGEDNCYRSPATAFAYGTLLKKCAKLLINECIKKEDEEKLKKCRDFQSIIEEDFASSVNKTVEENQKELRRHKKVQLPTMDDVRKLKNYLDSNRKKCFDFLSQNPFDFEIWKQLSEYTLTSIQMFNRRRAGEIERITIEDFRSYEAVNEKVDSEIFNTLTEENKILAKQYVRFQIRGKLARGVPVLLHINFVSCIELILNKRGEANVSSENPYIFGLPGGSEKYLRACALLRKFSNACGAQNPQTLRGTELRKHIATHCVLLNIQEEEVDDLANFLGHANKIHKEHYRMPIVTRDIVRMSRLLEKAQGECNMNAVDTSMAEDISKNMNTPMAEDISANINHSIPISLDGIHQSPSVLEGTSAKKRSVSPTGRVKRVSWTEEEKKVALDLFASHIEKGSLPSTSDCFDTIKENPVLKNRSPLQLKSWISNQLTKKKTIVRRHRVSTLYWSNEEKKLMNKLFSDHLKSRTLPSFTECLEAIAHYPILKNRSKETIKAWIFNQIKKDKKNATVL